MRMYEAISLTRDDFRLRDPDLDRMRHDLETWGDLWMIIEYEVVDYWIEGGDEKDVDFLHPDPPSPMPPSDIYVTPSPYVTWVSSSDGTSVTITSASAWITYTGNTVPSQLTVTGGDGETYVYTPEETSE